MQEVVVAERCGGPTAVTLSARVVAGGRCARARYAQDSYYWDLMAPHDSVGESLGAEAAATQQAL